MGSSPLRSSANFIFSLLCLSISHHSEAHHCRQLDFGSCSNPSIKYGWDIDGSQRYGYLPINDNDFPHGWSPDIATIEPFICNRLESPCNAPPETVQRCREAFNLYSGLSGDNAIDAWNSALGITERYDDNDNDDHVDDHCSSTYGDQNYQTTTTTTLYVEQSANPSTLPDLKTTTETSTTETTSTHSKTKLHTTQSHEIPSPSSTLTITLTLPSSPSSDRQAVSTTSMSTETQTQTTVETTTTDINTGIASTASASSSPDPNSNDDSGPGGGSPFDVESAAPTLAVLGNEGPLKLVFLLSLLALLIALWYR